MFASTANALPALSLTKTAETAQERMATVDQAIARLTAGLASGDEEAFREFHSRYFDRLYCFLLMVARGNEDEAGEALQQTMVRVARYAKVFRNEEVFWGWLKALARSVARDAGRQRRRYASLLERFSFLSRSEGIEVHSPEEHALREILSDALDELPAEERQLMEGKYVIGESVKELAARTGLTEKAVEGRLGRLRREMRTRLIEKVRQR